MALLAVVACGPASGGSGTADGDLVVFAAASLTESFTQIEQAFEAAHPDVDATLNFAGSSSLARQIVRGAPAEVFASANPQQMQRALQASEIARQPVTFVQNRLQIAVPADNPGDVQGLAAFGEEGLDIALCAEQVPCGAAARTALDVAGVDAEPDTLEQDVKAVLTKVRLGEVDAGLVYQTDVAAAGDAVEGISFPEAAEVVNDYKIAILDRAGNHPGAARAFVDLVTTPEGQNILADFGFDTATP